MSSLRLTLLPDVLVTKRKVLFLKLKSLELRKYDLSVVRDGNVVSLCDRDRSF